MPKMPAFDKQVVHGPVSGTLLIGKLLSYSAQELAIYDDNANPIRWSDVQTGAMKTSPEAEPDLSQATETLDGPVLFAGVVTDRFGHLHLNSLGRLWALEHLPKETKLLFTTRRPAKADSFPYLQPMLDVLGIKNEVVIRRSPVRMPELYTAPDLYGARHEGLGSAGYFDWLDKHLPPSGPVDNDLKIYVTRARLGPEFGRVANEDHLEKLLKAQGYQIFAPEDHSLSEQFATYQSAGELIFTESSSIHIFAMVRRPEQRIAVIQRRDPLPPLIRNQLVARPGAEPLKINAIRKILWPPVRRKNTSVAVLDCNILKDELAKHGFVSSDAPWPAPDAEMERASIEAGLGPGESMMDDAEREQFLKNFRVAKRKRLKRARSA